MKNARKLEKRKKKLGKINSSVYCSRVSSISHIVRGEIKQGEKGAEVFKINKCELYPPLTVSLAVVLCKMNQEQYYLLIHL